MNLKMQRRLRIMRAELFQKLRQHVLRRDNHCCQIETSNDCLPQFGNLVFRSSRSLEKILCMAIEEHASLRQIHAPSDSAKKCDPQSAFQLLYLCRNVGLAHLEFFRSPREARVPGNGFKYPDGRECH